MGAMWYGGGMRWIAPVAAMLLFGCNGLFGPSEAEKAKREFRIVSEKSIDGRDLCAAARKVEAAYLAEGNAERYEYWNLIASAHC